MNWERILCSITLTDCFYCAKMRLAFVGVFLAGVLAGAVAFAGTSKDAPMPPRAVLILCKSEPDGPPDMNAEWTHVRKRKWVYEHSMMVCKREEIDLTWIPGEKLTRAMCAKSAIMEMADWEIKNQDSEYQPWRVACPTPIVDLKTGRILDWKMPECGHRDTVKCEGEVTDI